MTLTEFIERVKLENGIQFDTKDIEKSIVEKARKAKTGNCAAVDDETVKKWILEYKPGEKKEEKKAEPKEEAKTVAVPVGKSEESGEWGTQESLF